MLCKFVRMKVMEILTPYIEWPKKILCRQIHQTTLTHHAPPSTGCYSGAGDNQKTAGKALYSKYSSGWVVEHSWELSAVMNQPPSGECYGTRDHRADELGADNGDIQESGQWMSPEWWKRECDLRAWTGLNGKGKGKKTSRGWAGLGCSEWGQATRS